jgi:hypothetical protein
MLILPLISMKQQYATELLAQTTDGVSCSIQWHLQLHDQCLLAWLQHSSMVTNANDLYKCRCSVMRKFEAFRQATTALLNTQCSLLNTQ